jgi:hypothetical protein
MKEHDGLVSRARRQVGTDLKAVRVDGGTVPRFACDRPPW